jgi:tripartite-type tricarboxylate transporter receptor subunit TctC
MGTAFSVLRGAAVLGVAVIGSSAAFGQSYPSKPLRIVTSEPGGGVDFMARLLAQELAGPLGQTIVVDNKPSGVIPGDTVAKATPDGYTLLVFGNTLWVGPLLGHTPYDPVRDFAPVIMTSRSPNVLVVHPSLAAKSVGELIALAKSKPGALNYGSAGSGGAPHLAAELFKYMARVDIVRIPYRGAGPALIALIGGQVQLMFANAASVTQQVKSGALRALAVASAEPTNLAPGLPTIAASGVPGYESVSIAGLLAPAKTPSAVVAKLNQEAARALLKPDVRQKILNAGSEAAGGSPAEFAAVIKAEMARLAPVIKAADIHGE